MYIQRWPGVQETIQNVTAYYEAELKKSFSVKGEDGNSLGKEYRPLARVGIYIP